MFCAGIDAGVGGGNEDSPSWGFEFDGRVEDRDGMSFFYYFFSTSIIWKLLILSFRFGSIVVCLFCLRGE